MASEKLEEIRAFYAAKGAQDKAAAHTQIVRNAYVALDSGNVEGFFSVFAPEAKLVEADGLPYGGEYAGIEGCKRCFEAMLGAWKKVTWRVTELTAGGDLVVVLLDAEFVAKKSGKSFSMPVSESWRFAAYRVVEVRPFYFDTHYIRAAYLEE